jgi:hypothetical protein
MAMPPRVQKETASRPMTGRTVGVAVAALLLGGAVLKFGLDKPAKVTTDGNSSASVAPSKGSTTIKGGATTTTTAAGGVSTTAAPIVATPAPVNSAVDILVANGAEIQGIAGEVGASLQSKGYRVLSPATNALTTASASTVYFSAGNGPLAKFVATDLGIATAPVAMPPTLPVKEIRTAGILVLLGTDFKKANIPTANALKGTAGAAAPAVTAATPATVAAPATAVTSPNTTAKAAVTTTTVKK